MREFFSNRAVLFLMLFLSLLIMPQDVFCKEDKPSVYKLSQKDIIELAIKNNKDIQIQEQERR